MRRSRLLGASALLALLGVAACEDITNPVEEFGELADPYVRFEDSSAIAPPDSETLVIFQMPTRVEEDVTIQYSFAGDAVFGDDYWAVDADGAIRDDVTAAGGTAQITYDPEQTTFARDTLRLFVDFEAEDGRQVIVEIESAQTASGRTVETGFIDDFRRFVLSIEGFVDIEEGTYSGERTGDLGADDVSVTITKPAEPITIEGAAYSFVISDYAAGGLLIPVPWSFNVTSGGSVVAAPRSHGATDFVTSDVGGSFSFATNTLTLDVVGTCCGIEDDAWQLTISLDDD